MSKLSDKDIVNTVQDYKIAHNEQLFHKSSSEVRASTLDRARHEKADLLTLAGQNIEVTHEARPTKLEPKPEQVSKVVDTQMEHHAHALKQGDHGSAVLALQTALAAHGAKIAVDGVFGHDTEKAVKGYQMMHDLKVDGVAGPETMRELGKVHAMHYNGSELVPDHSHTQITNPVHIQIIEKVRQAVNEVCVEKGRALDEGSENMGYRMASLAVKNIDPSNRGYIGFTGEGQFTAGVTADYQTLSIGENFGKRGGHFISENAVVAANTPKEQSLAEIAAYQTPTMAIDQTQTQSQKQSRGPSIG